MSTEPFLFSNEEIAPIATRADLEHLLFERMVHLTPVYDRIQYETDLELLQIELLKMQNWITQQGMRVAILFEGRDAAGKGGLILGKNIAVFPAFGEHKSETFEQGGQVSDQSLVNQIRILVSTGNGEVGLGFACKEFQCIFLRHYPGIDKDSGGTLPLFLQCLTSTQE